MEVIKSIRINITIDDIVEHLPAITKEQLVEKFRLLLDRKEIEINEKIEKLNGEHLLLLQKKVLVIQKKNDQIVKLNSTLAETKNQLNDEKMKNNDLIDDALQLKFKVKHLEAKNSSYDDLVLQMKEKNHNLQKECFELKKKNQQINDLYLSQERTSKKLKEEKVTWMDETDLLLSNLKNTLLESKRYEIKHVTLHYENRISEMKEKMKEEKKKIEQKREKIVELNKANISLSKKIQRLGKQIEELNFKHQMSAKEKIDQQIQTKGQSVDSFEKVTNFQSVQKAQMASYQIQTIQTEECHGCLDKICEIKELKKTVKLYKTNKKGISEICKSQKKDGVTQTTENLYTIKNTCSSQTQSKYLELEDERALISNFEVIKKSAERLLEIEKQRYEQLEREYEKRPSRKEDIQNILKLQCQIVQLRMTILDHENKIESLNMIIEEHDRKIRQFNSFNSLLDRFDVKQNQNRSMASMINTMSLRNKSQTINPDSLSISRMGNKKSMRSIHQSKLGHDRTIDSNEGLMNQSSTIRVKTNEGKSRSHSPTCHRFQSINNIFLEKGITFKEKTSVEGKDIIKSNRFRDYKKYKNPLKSGKKSKLLIELLQ